MNQPKISPFLERKEKETRKERIIQLSQIKLKRRKIQKKSIGSVESLHSPSNDSIFQNDLPDDKKSDRSDSVDSYKEQKSSKVKNILNCSQPIFPTKPLVKSSQHNRYPSEITRPKKNTLLNLPNTTSPKICQTIFSPKNKTEGFQVSHIKTSSDLEIQYYERPTPRKQNWDNGGYCKINEVKNKFNSKLCISPNQSPESRKVETPPFKEKPKKERGKFRSEDESQKKILSRKFLRGNESMSPDLSQKINSSRMPTMTTQQSEDIPWKSHMKLKTDSLFYQDFTNFIDNMSPNFERKNQVSPKNETSNPPQIFLPTCESRSSPDIFKSFSKNFNMEEKNSSRALHKSKIHKNMLWKELFPKEEAFPQLKNKLHYSKNCMNFSFDNIMQLEDHFDRFYDSGKELFIVLHDYSSPMEANPSWQIVILDSQVDEADPSQDLHIMDNFLGKCTELLKQRSRLKYVFSQEGEPIHSYKELVQSNYEAVVISHSCYARWLFDERFVQKLKSQVSRRSQITVQNFFFASDEKGRTLKKIKSMEDLTTTQEDEVHKRILEIENEVSRNSQLPLTVEEKNNLDQIQNQLMEEEMRIEQDLLQNQLSLLQKLTGIRDKSPVPPSIPMNMNRISPRDTALPTPNSPKSAKITQTSAVGKPIAQSTIKEKAQTFKIKNDLRRDVSHNFMIDKIKKKIVEHTLAKVAKVSDSSNLLLSPTALLPNIQKKSKCSLRHKDPVTRNLDMTSDLYTNKIKLKDLISLIDQETSKWNQWKAPGFKAKTHSQARKDKDKQKIHSLLNPLQIPIGSIDGDSYQKATIKKTNRAGNYRTFSNETSQKGLLETGRTTQYQQFISATNSPRKKKEKNFIMKNIEKFHDKNKIFYNILSEYYNALFYKNIPKLICRSHLPRKQLHQLFIQFKVLCLLTAHRIESKDFLERNTRGKGIDFYTFRKGLREVYLENKFVAKRIFDLMDSNNDNVIEWEEFVIAMKTLQAKTIKEKIDLFFNLIDEDGSGRLSYEEVYKICKLVLKQAGAENENFLHEFSDFFTKVIFEVARVSFDEEIPLSALKEAIERKEKEAELLIMFCGVDNFKEFDIDHSEDEILNELLTQ